MMEPVVDSGFVNGSTLTNGPMKKALVCAALVGGCASSASAPQPRPVISVSPAAEREVQDEPPPPPPPHDPVRPAASYLDTKEDTVTRRARMAFHESLFATEPQPGVGPMATGERYAVNPWESVAVVEERPGSLRLLIESAGIRVVAYVLDAQVLPVVRRRARATLGVDRAVVDTGPDGVWVTPGLIARPGGGMRRSVMVKDPMFEGEAWVARSAVDRVYEDTPEVDREGDTVVRKGATIRSQDGDPLLATPAANAVAVKIIARADDHVRVRYAGEQLWVEGWVARDDVTPISKGAYGNLWGTGSGTGWGVSHATIRYLHAGDILRATPTGEQIGAVIQERVRAIERDCDASTCALQVHVGGWPWLPMWIDAADARFGDAWEKNYLDRVTLTPQPSNAALPTTITTQHDDIATCWEAAVAAGTGAIETQLTWKTGRSIDVPQLPGMSDELHSCLESALGHLYTGPGASLPFTFLLRMKPTPLPQRSPR